MKASCRWIGFISSANQQETKQRRPFPTNHVRISPIRTRARYVSCAACRQAAESRVKNKVLRFANLDAVASLPQRGFKNLK
jgi:hypothetical protein